MSPRISVVLCTFNGEKFLPEQIESILSQSVLPTEIVVSDDGSTDKTLDIIRDYETRSSPNGPQWQILRNKKPLGVSRNFEKALSHATGDFIALCDHDDVWENNRLAAVLSHFDNERVSLVHSDAMLIDAHGIQTGSLMDTLRLSAKERKALVEGRTLDALLRRNLVTGATTMVRRSLLKCALPIPPGWIHDEWLAFVAASAEGVVSDFRPLVRYRQHGGNEIGASKLNLRRASTKLNETRTSFLAAKSQRNQGIEEWMNRNPRCLGPSARQKIQHKLNFEAWRRELPAVRMLRIIPIATKWLRGDYDRYARGLIDVIRDLWLTG
ncbi:MAG: hypothetical protein RL187_817 [Actinomycetota bacterium]